MHGFHLLKFEFITDHVEFLENKWEEEFVEEQRDNVDFLEVLKIGGNKLVNIWEGQILEDCRNKILEFGPFACLV